MNDPAIEGTVVSIAASFGSPQTQNCLPAPEPSQKDNQGTFLAALRESVSVKVSRTPASDTLAPCTGPVSEKQQCTKSRLLRWCSALSVPRAEPYGD